MLKAWIEKQICHLYYPLMNNRSRQGILPVDANAEVQDNTLQPESPEKEDTGIKQVGPVNVQNQDVEENAESVQINAREQQKPVITWYSQVEEVQQEQVQQ